MLVYLMKKICFLHVLLFLFSGLAVSKAKALHRSGISGEVPTAMAM